MNNAVTRPAMRLLKRALMGSAASSLVLSIIACPAFAEDLSFPSLLPAFVSQPLDAPKPPPVPLAVFGDTMPDPGHLTISVIPQFGEGAHQMMGTRNITAQQAASTFPGWYWNPTVAYTTIPVAMFTEAQALTLAYGIMPNLSLVILTGTQEKHSHLVTMYGSSNLIPRGMSFPGTDSLLDSQAAVVWRAYEDQINRVKINLGMSFPTGSNHDMGGAVMNTSGGYNVGWAFYGMQTGTNTFDVMPGILYAGTIKPWSWGLSYRARLPLTVNPEGYNWGNYQELNGWIGYTLLPGLTTTVRLNYNIQSQIVGAGWFEAGKLPSANPENWGGKMIQVFGGADIDGKLFGYPGFSIGLEGGVPVYQNLNGPQLSRVWQAGMALRWKVGEEETEEKVSKTGIFKGPAPALASTSSHMPWDGVHVGVSGGFEWAADKTANFTYAGTSAALAGGFPYLYAHGGLPASVSLGSQGVIGGAQLGYDRQLYQNFVAGLEADLSGLGVGNSSKASWQGSPLVYLQTGRNQHFFGTVRGRVGYLVTPDVLVYATGGAVFGENDLNATYFAPTLSPQLYLGNSAYGFTDMMLGWTAGAGVEWLFNPKWSVKAEYLYYDLGTANTANIGPLWYSNTKAHALSSAGVRADFDGNVVRLGVNYHFNGFAPAPLLAKY